MSLATGQEPEITEEVPTELEAEMDAELDAELDEALDAASEPTIEDIARANGWKPESEWKGNPPRDGFKSAADFVKDGFKIQQTQHDKIDRLEEQLTGISEKMDQMSAGEAKRLHKALEAQAERLKTERAEAITEMDRDRFEKIDAELRQTEEEMRNADQVQSNDAFVVGEEKFKRRNDWFEKDKAMTATAYNIAAGLRNAFPDMTADEYYTELENAVKEQFPNKFTNPRRAGVAPVEGGTPQKNTNRRKGFDSLPAEAKQAFEELSFYNKKMTKADYAKAFYEMETN